MIKYKLTSEKMTSYRDFRWEVGVPCEAPGDPPRLCSSGWLHYYHHPLVAALTYPAHLLFAYTEARLWECEAEGKCLDEALKGGCTRLTLVRELPLPKFTPGQLERVALTLALDVVSENDEPEFCAWAGARLDGIDRSGAAAVAAFERAYKRMMGTENWADKRRFSVMYWTTLVAQKRSRVWGVYGTAHEYVAMCMETGFTPAVLPKLERAVVECG